ncbi:MAG: SDR family oxidoreductase [Bryobacteraceae bacterium]
MSSARWALVLGASSGFGEAVALQLAEDGMDIFGVHLDRRETLPKVERIRAGIRGFGRECVFFNANAGDDEKRCAIIEEIKTRQPEVKVLFHSLAFGALKPLADLNRRQMETTADIMGHSLVYWTRDLIAAGLMSAGGRIFAMTSEGGIRAVPQYGAVSAAKAILEAHIRQLALELAPLGITANAILAGVADTPALRKIPGHETIVEFARRRNPHGRLTTPVDVARCVSVLCHPNTYWMTGNTLRVDGGENSVG